MKSTTTNSSRAPENFQDLLSVYVNRLKENKEMEARLKSVRLENNNLRKEADKIEENLKAIQNTGQLIGEILKKIDTEKCIKIII
jgi:26S proteasome regulatory subunit T4